MQTKPVYLQSNSTIREHLLKDGCKGLLMETQDMGGKGGVT